MSYDVVIVSAFGRGHWLAVEFCRSGLNTLLLDVSDRLGRSVPEEYEGPFGFFHNESILESQWERLIEDDPLHEVSQGFTLWLHNGPIEFKGQLTWHSLRQRGVPESVSKDDSFSKKWLTHLSHSLASSIYTRNSNSDQYGFGLPLFARHLIRYPSRLGTAQSIDWCRRNQVQVKENTEIVDISTHTKGGIFSIEIRSSGEKKSEIIQAQHYIFQLTSEEISFMNSQWATSLISKKINLADWFWCRFQMKISEGHEQNQIPMSCLIIENLEFPWTHENFVFLQKTMVPNLFDVWIRIPTSQRFHRLYLQEMGDRLLALLHRKLPSSEISIHQYPLGYDSTYEELGPLRLPVFSHSINSKRKSNLIWDGPEQWPLLGWNGQFSHQQKIFKEVYSSWLQKKQKENKNDREIHPS